MPTRDSDSLFLTVLTPSTGTSLPLEVDVYSYANYATKIDTLQGAFEVSFLKQLDDCGTGTFKISKWDPKATPANLHVDNLVKIKIDGVERFAFFMEEFAEVTASPKEGAGEITQVLGRGALAYLERAEVYPATWPTTNATDIALTAEAKGKVLYDQLVAAQARGGLPALSWDFTATQDSVANPWADALTDTLGIGTDLFSLAKKLCSYGDLHVWMDPHLKLHLYRVLGSDRTQSVVFAKGRHIGLEDVQKHTHNIQLRTRLLVLGSGGEVIEVANPALEAEPGIGRREGSLSYSTTADHQAMNDAGQAQLAASAGDAEPLQLSVNHGLGGGLYEPFIDYDVGDIIAIDSLPDWDHVGFQIVGLTVAHKETGNQTGGDYKVVLDLSGVYLDPLSALAQQVGGLGGGAGSTTYSGGIPVPASGLVAPAPGDTPGYLRDKLLAGPGIVLGLVGVAPAEQLEVSSTGFASPLTTKGDLIAAAAAGVPSRLPVGPDAQVLTADSTQPLGLKWVPTAAGGSANEDLASSLVNATSAGDAGGRADHFTGAALAAKWATTYGVGFAALVKNSMANFSNSSGANVDTGAFQAYTPSGAFQLEARIQPALSTDAAAIEVSDSAVLASLNAVGVSVIYSAANDSGTCTVTLFSRDAGTYNGRTVISIPGANFVYVALARDGANNWTAYYSFDRATWIQVGTYAKTLVAAYLKLTRYVHGTASGGFDFVDVVS